MFDRVPKWVNDTLCLFDEIRDLYQYAIEMHANMYNGALVVHETLDFGKGIAYTDIRKPDEAYPNKHFTEIWEAEYKAAKRYGIFYELVGVTMSLPFILINPVATWKSVMHGPANRSLEPYSLGFSDMSEVNES
ncbi:MAG: hypothetical protein HY513_05140 [Candidatus Aenigmarchaeota archaeon]|nr:hypothetical protein [Candidatus Aenigmarchaeota archaeon]